MKARKDDDLRTMINLRTQEREANRKNLEETQATVSNTERRTTSDDTHNPRASLSNEVQIVEHHTQGTPALEGLNPMPYVMGGRMNEEKGTTPITPTGRRRMKIEVWGVMIEDRPLIEGQGRNLDSRRY